MSLDLTDDKSTLVQVMAWCRQATSHYLSQCWPRSLSPYGVTRPQWIKFVSTSCETPIRWMPQNTFDDKSTLYQVMGWHHQATSHYLSQCWPRPLLPYDIARHNELHFLCIKWVIFALLTQVWPAVLRRRTRNPRSRNQCSWRIMRERSSWRREGKDNVAWRMMGLTGV